MIWTIFFTLLVLWLLGVIGSVGGQFIYVLLLVAGAVLLFKLISNRRGAF